MNYIRGALQYYKDLPPINPATLTGAIDVIAIRKDDGKGGYEIAASPFHVRFGKFQILRPGDKKVRSR
jgi:phosphatidate phosphatase LPIN